MDGKRVVVLLIAISVALLGLMAIQVKWMHDNVQLRENQFNIGVRNALFSVSEKLERLDRMRELGHHAAGRKLLLRLDTLRSLDEKLLGMNTEAQEVGRGIEVDLSLVEGPDDEVRSVEMEDNGDGQEELVADMVRMILAKEQSRDIHERIPPALLDSLLKAELLTNGVDAKWSRAVYSIGKDPILIPDDVDADHALLLATPHKERLFKHDLAGPPYYLHVAIPDQERAILGSLLPLIGVSALLVAVLVMAFVFSMRTILKQKRLNDIRNDLVNNLTHELKTPISTIGLACEALTDPGMPKTDQQVRTFVTMIRDENKRLGSLVENVLQSAVMDGGLMVIKPVDLDMHDLVRDVVQSSSIQVSRRNGRIELELVAEIHHLQGDRIHLTNLLYNLVDNAVKYSEKEPRIRIHTKNSDVGFTVSVSDNGIGIASGEQKKIFDRLYRVPTGNLHNAKGFGLGLSYVRTVVLRHNGTINVDSTPGSGSTFRIFLPFEHVRKDQAVTGRG